MFEGGEGSGKSTQAALLASSLGAVLTREPGGTATGEHIRTLLLDPAVPAICHRAETLLLLAARAQHVEEVMAPALAGGRDVVCDRFAGSTIAYQGFGRGLDPTELERLSSWAARGIEPDLVLLLTLPRAEAEARRAARGVGDRFEVESAEFFSRIDVGFASLAAGDPRRWRVVDGTGTVEEVAERIAEVVAEVRHGWRTAERKPD